MNDADADTDTSTAPASPVRDVGLREVRRTVLAVMVLAAVIASLATLMHWLDPRPQLVDRVAPAVLAAVFAVLALRQWRKPDAMASNLWIGWWTAVAGLALPTWWYIAVALRGDELLVDLLPPIGAALLPTLIGMALFAQPRQALVSTLIAWTAVGAPVLVYLAAHPPEWWTPRGVELVLALGPCALFVPLLVPLLRGVERRFRLLRAERERLQVLAERDVLSGLYNRRAGERFLSTLLAHRREDAALVLFDIDHFKRINDNFGHPAGDAVLVEVGRRCGVVLARDDIFARWGGEEFLVVLPDAPPQTGAAVAERLRVAICGSPISPVGAVSASFGVTGVRPGDSLEEVLQRADEALYRAKSGGRNRVEAG